MPVCAPAPSRIQPAGADVDCSRVAHVRLVDMAPRLGSGVDVAVRLQDADGAPLDAATYARCVHITRADCAALDAVHTSAAIPADGAMTAVLVAPGRSAASAARARAVVEALLAARPAGERIAIFRWGTRVHQVANFGTDRAVATRLAAAGLAEADEAPLPPAQAVAAMRNVVDTLARGAFRGVRSLVVVAPEGPGDLEGELAEGSAGGSAGSSTDVLVAASSQEPSAAAAALSDALDARIDAGLVRLTWCSDGTRDVRIAAYDSAAGLAVHTPAPLPEEAHMQCTPEALVGPRAHPERIEMVFASDAQRQDYEQRVEEQSKEPFDVMLRLWQDGALVEARAHLRGQSSLLFCQRKSFDVNIQGDVPRRLMPGSAINEFYLVAMCMDRFYINQYPADLLSARLGFFPLAVRFVELVVDGEHQGIYLLIEEPQAELLGDNSRVRSIVRRKEDAYGKPPEVKYGFESEAQALADYESLVGSIQAGASLEDIAQQMDIDQYLRWIALMTLLGNGDYIDEVYFVSTETVDTALAPADFYSIVGWDPDDLFAECHDDGEYAFDDPNDLAYCAEALIDHALLDDERIYARYVDVLASVLSKVTEDVYGALLDDTVGKLDTYFRDEAIRRAMVELHADDPNAAPAYEQVMEDIREAAAGMKRTFADRHEALRAIIAAWREDNR